MSVTGKRTRRHSFTTLEDISKQLDMNDSTACTTAVKEDSSSRKRPAISPSSVSEGSSPKERPVGANVVTASTDLQQTNKLAVIDGATAEPVDATICLPQGTQAVMRAA